MRWKKTHTNLFYTSPFPINQCWTPLASSRTHWCHSTLCGGEGMTMIQRGPQSVPTLFSKIVVKVYSVESSISDHIYKCDWYIREGSWSTQNSVICWFCYYLGPMQHFGSFWLLPWHYIIIYHWLWPDTIFSLVDAIPPKWKRAVKMLNWMIIPIIKRNLS